MTGLRTVVLTITEGRNGPRVRASLAYSLDGQRTAMQLTWPKMQAEQEEVDMGTWLLRKLEAVVEGFDEHTIDDVEVTGVQDMKEDPRG